jgi:hypothetical protein
MFRQQPIYTHLNISTAGQMRDNSSAVARRWMTTLMPLLAAVCMIGCPGVTDPTVPCGPRGDGLVFIAQTPGVALLSPALETSFANGRRTFFWSKTVENVCSSEHVQVSWNLWLAPPSERPAGWEATAGWAISPFVGRDVALTYESSTDSYQGKSEIGLKQAYEGKPGRFLMALEISFTSQGIETVDREVLQRAMGVRGAIWMNATYKLHPND